MKSAVALIEQNDPQLQTQLDIRFSVSHPEKDHRTPQKRNSFIIPSIYVENGCILNTLFQCDNA